MALSKIDTAAIAGVGTDALPAGTVVQVKTQEKTAIVSKSFTSSDTSEIDVIELTITPTSSTNKILVMAQVPNGGTMRYQGFHLYRGSTEIGMGSATGGRTAVFLTGGGDDAGTIGDQYILHMAAGHVYDSPATTNAVTYKITMENSANDTRTFYVNRPLTDSAASWHQRGSTKLTLMEVVA